MYFVCELCNFNCINKRAFDSHINSKKHIKNGLIARGQLVEQPKTYTCNQCNNVYNHYSSLARHKKTCIPQQITSTAEEVPQHVQEVIIQNWIARQPNTHAASNMPITTPIQPAPNHEPEQQVSNPEPAHQVPNPEPVRHVNAFGNENYACVTFGGNYEILRRPVDAFEYMIDDLYDDPSNINIIIMDKRNYLLKYIKTDRTIEILSLSTLIKKALAQNKQKFLEYCIQHMDVVNPGSQAQDIRNYSVTEHGLYNNVTGTTELIYNNTIRNIMPDFMSNTCLNHYNSEFKEILKIKFLEIAHSTTAKLNFKNL